MKDKRWKNLVVVRYDYLSEYPEARCRAVMEAAFEKAHIQDEVDPKIPDEMSGRLFCRWAETAERLARENGWEVLVQCDDMAGQIWITGDMVVRDQTNLRTLGEPLQKLGEQATEFVLGSVIRNG